MWTDIYLKNKNLSTAPDTKTGEGRIKEEIMENTKAEVHVRPTCVEEINEEKSAEASVLSRTNSKRNQILTNAGLIEKQKIYKIDIFKIFEMIANF